MSRIKRLQRYLFPRVIDRFFPDQGAEIGRLVEMSAAAYRAGPYLLPPEKLLEQFTAASGGLGDLLSRLELDEFELFASDPLSFTSHDRARAVRYARHMHATNLAVERAVEMWTDFGAGQKVEYGSDDPGADEFLKEFTNSPRNESVLGEEQAEQISIAALNEGEVAIAHWLSFDGVDTVRLIPTDQLEILWLDPDDKTTPLWYVRKTDKGELYYPDWRATEAELNRRPPPDRAIRLDRPSGDVVDTVRIGGQDQPATRAVIQWHVRRRQINGRGLPQFLNAFEWAKVLEEFMSDRAAVARKAAMYTDNVTIQGGSRAVQAARSALESSLVNTTSGAGSWFDRNPPARAGSDWLQNALVNREWQNRDSGAAGARFDGRMIAGWTGLGVGVPLHWFGFPDAIPGGLATARELLRPWLEQLKRYRTWITAVYRTMGVVALSVAAGPGITVADLPTVNVSLDLSLIVDIETLVRIFDSLSGAIEKGTFPPLEGETIMRVIMFLILDKIGVKDAEKLTTEAPEPEAIDVAVAEIVQVAIRNYKNGTAEADDVVDFLTRELVGKRLELIGENGHG